MRQAVTHKDGRFYIGAKKARPQRIEGVIGSKALQERKVTGGKGEKGR